MLNWCWRATRSWSRGRVYWIAGFYLAGMGQPQALLLAKDNPPIEIRALSFMGKDLWRAIDARYIPVGNGRYRTHSISSAALVACEDMLTKFQTPPLEGMVKRGSIPREMAADLLRLPARGIDPDQIVAITLSSVMKIEAARALFGGQIPSNRILRGEESGLAPDEVRIYRGSSLFIRGWRLIPKGNGFAVQPAKLAWEIEEQIPQGARAFDGDTVPLRVEVGRAFMGEENDPLPGDFRLALHVLTTLMVNELTYIGRSPKDLLVTLHTIQARTTQLFSRIFPVRLLNPHLQAAIETNFPEAMANYESAPRPPASVNEAILVGSFARFVERFPPAAVSDRVHRLVTEFRPGHAPEETSRALVEWSSLAREDYTYQIHGLRTPQAPLRLFYWCTPDYFQRVRRVALRLNIQQYDPRDFMRFLQQDLRGFFPQSLLEAGMAHWLEPSLFLPLPVAELQRIQQTGSRELPLSLAVSNFDRAAFRTTEEGFLYFRSLISAVSRIVERRIDGLVGEEYNYTLRVLNEFRRERGLVPALGLDLATYFETVPLVLQTSDSEMRGILAALGAKPYPGSRFTHTVQMARGAAELEEGRASLSYQDEEYFAFRWREIEAIRATQTDAERQGTILSDQNFWRVRLNALQGLTL